MFGLMMLAVAFLIIYLVISNNKTKHKEQIKSKSDMSTYISSIPNFNSTQTYLALDSYGNFNRGIAVDEDNKNIALVSSKYGDCEHRIIPFSQIISSEIIEDEVSINKYSKSGVVVGGLLAGAPGAIIGGLGNKQNKNKVRKLGLKIVVDSISDSEFTFYSLNAKNPIDKNNPSYITAKKIIDKWHNIISIVIKRAESM